MPITYFSRLGEWAALETANPTYATLVELLHCSVTEAWLSNTVRNALCFLSLFL